MQTVAIACLFLAGKVEETPKKLKNIIDSSDAVRKSKQSTKEMEKLIEDVIEKEKLLLKLLNFDFKIEHPYKSVMHYIYNLKKDDKYKDKVKELAQYAWNFVNDSFQTLLCLQYPPRKIAAACIYLSTNQYINIQLPDGWEQSDVFKTTHAENEKISKIISALYPQQPKKKLPFEVIDNANTSGSASSSINVQEQPSTTENPSSSTLQDTQDSIMKGNSESATEF